MKKTLSVILAALLLMSLLGACARTAPAVSPTDAVTPPAASSAAPATAPAETPTPEEPTVIRLGGLKGPTSIGMVKLLADAEDGASANKYEFTLAGSADELTPKLLKGELDVIAAPVNLGSILYNNAGGVQLAAVNTLGVVYIVEKGGETIQSLADLAGKTIYATGKGSTPEFALTYLLAQAGLDIDADVTMEWKSEPTETVAALNAADNAVAMLPQPYVTVAQTQVEGLRIALDLSEEWAALDNGSLFITAGLIVRTEFIETYPEQFAAFLEEYRASTQYVNANVAEAAALCERFDIVKAAVAEKAISYCNIVYIDGAEMASAVGGFLDILYTLKPEAVGGALPADDFYYAG